MELHRNAIDEEEKQKIAVRFGITEVENKMKDRIKELTAKIPVGTVCDETNNCGGYLTAEEAAELEQLLTKQENDEPDIS